ncbi:MAG: glycoside hydrolase family 9 protein [Chitinophagales bacterium]|nr:glycoside hydrolase family 9 protein [Bacteroidota bacterium]MCB9042294.1 glycoside hydrolase family 9 protein [Chitinophagales bacterium]
MRYFLFLLLFAAQIGFAQSGTTGTGSVIIGTNNRTYTYYLPVDFDAACSYPLLIAYHGSGGTGNGMKNSTDFESVADAERFIVVYPNGTCANNEWNTNCGSCSNDDIAFTQQLITKMNTDFNIDESRVYLAGMSNGGFFVNYLASQNSSGIAARAVVAGNLCGYWNPVLTAGIPYIHFHAINDPVVQYYDDEPDGIIDWPVSYFAYGWNFADVACTGYTVTNNSPVTGTDKITFTNCQNDNEVVVIRSGTSSHSWNIGVAALNTNQEIWNFVKQYDINGYNPYTPPSCSAQPEPTIDHDHFCIDQFGYRTGDQKIAIIRQAATGFDAPDSYTPAEFYALRRQSDGDTVYIHAKTYWESGAEHTQSGDYVCYFDFSNITTPDEYYIYDSENNIRSESFWINDDVYDEVMVEALRTFYYQRCGTAKTTPYAPSQWTDAACHVGAGQDYAALDMSNPIPSTAKDVSGGWHDAGDYNKYVPFAYNAVHHLLLAYEQNSYIFGDNNNIPESGNGVPDILDEVKWELDWLLKMQNTGGGSNDGGVHIKVSVSNFQAASPPSTDNAAHYYGPIHSASTRTTCSMLAHAAVVFATIPGMSNYADTLRNRAIRAWNWTVAHPTTPIYNNAGFQSANPDFATWSTTDHDYWHQAIKTCAAVYLFAATGNTTYKTYFDNNYTALHSYAWTYWYPFEPIFNETMLYYCALSGATTTVKNNIQNNCVSSVSTNNSDLLPAFLNNTDAYRAYLKDDDYTWGSNTFKSQAAHLFQNMNYYYLNPANYNNYQNAAAGFLHYFHGVNPQGYAFLSNMDEFGAEKSVNEIYHSWFGDGTDFDNAQTSLYGPPPGFMPVGVNKNYAPDAAFYSAPYNGTAADLTPPLNQPIQKSYRDFNTNWPQNSWLVSEVGIYTQAAYIKLLSHFVTPPECFPIYYDDYAYGTNGVYTLEVSDYINSSSQVSGSYTLNYDAGNYIDLIDGFWAQAGCNFHAYIDGCGGAKNDGSMANTTTTVELPTNKATISVLLNPFENEITFRASQAVTLLQVFDVQGNILWECSHFSGEKNIPASHFPAGMYIAKAFLQDGSVQSLKMVKY